MSLDDLFKLENKNPLPSNAPLFPASAYSLPPTPHKQAPSKSSLPPQILPSPPCEEHETENPPLDEAFAEQCINEYHTNLDNWEDEPTEEDLQVMRIWEETGEWETSDSETLKDKWQSYEDQPSSETDFESPLVSCECEQLLLGGYFNNPNLMIRHSESQIHSLFYYPRHRTIYEAMTKTQPLTLENLITQLAFKSQLEKVGGIGYLGVLLQSAKDHFFAHEINSYVTVLETLKDLRNQ